jgi:probable HAF family extracellular repeat protein
VGSYRDGFGDGYGFLLDNGSYSPLDVPLIPPFFQDNFTGASGINDSGQIVGGFVTGGHRTTHGFLFDQGSYTTLDVPGATDGYAGGTSPGGINDSGQIVGSYVDASGRHGFLATPVP